MVCFGASSVGGPCCALRPLRAPVLCGGPSSWFASRRRAFFCGRRACWRGALCGRSAPGEPFPWLPCLSTLFTCHAHVVRFHASRTRLFPALHVLGSASLLPAYRGLCPWFHGRIVLPSVTHSLGGKKKKKKCAGWAPPRQPTLSAALPARGAALGLASAAVAAGGDPPGHLPPRGRLGAAIHAARG